MERGTTGAPRDTPDRSPGAPAASGDTRTAQLTRANGLETRPHDIGYTRPVGSPEAQARPGVMGRLIAIICGRRSKYLVVAFWIVVVAALGPLSGKLQGAERNGPSYLPSSAASTQELNEQNLFRSGNLNPALVTYVRSTTVTAAGPRKAGATDPTLLFAALGAVIGLLLLTYRSPVLWLLPIISAGVSLIIAEAVSYLLIQHADLTVNGQSGAILVVLAIGAGTDYALLLIPRYREELRRHADRHEAMAVALRRVGPAIIASGLTVVTGMLCLLAAESNDISGLGPVTAVGIAVGLIVMITLLPALLVVFGSLDGLTSDIGRHMWWPSALANPESGPVADGT